MGRKYARIISLGTIFLVLLLNLGKSFAQEDRGALDVLNHVIMAWNGKLEDEYELEHQVSQQDDVQGHNLTKFRAEQVE